MTPEEIFIHEQHVREQHVREQHLRRCYELAQMSTCSKAKFGSVVVDSDGVIASEGYNFIPNSSCDDCRNLCAGGIRQGVKSGTRAELCYTAWRPSGWLLLYALHSTYLGRRHSSCSRRY